MQRILESTSLDDLNTGNAVTSNNSTGNIGVTTSTSKSIIDSGTSKKIIDDNMKNEKFQKLFKLTGEDVIQGE